MGCCCFEVFFHRTGRKIPPFRSKNDSGLSGKARRVSGQVAASFSGDNPGKERQNPGKTTFSALIRDVLPFCGILSARLLLLRYKLKMKILGK